VESKQKRGMGSILSDTIPHLQMRDLEEQRRRLEETVATQTAEHHAKEKELRARKSSDEHVVCARPWYFLHPMPRRLVEGLTGRG